MKTKADKVVHNAVEETYEADQSITEQHKVTQMVEDLRRLRSAFNAGETTIEFALGRAALLGAGQRELALRGLEYVFSDKTN